MSDTLNLVNPDDVLSCKYEISIFPDGKIGLYNKVSWNTEDSGLLQTIYKNGEFYNTTTLSEIREKLKV
jgi:hypothetical protein